VNLVDPTGLLPDGTPGYIGVSSYLRATPNQQPQSDQCVGRRHDRARHPEYIRSDNSLEFVSKELRQWLARTGAAMLYIEPGSPWENGYCESFNSSCATSS
jgi:transposase InsO family protein